MFLQRHYKHPDWVIFFNTTIMKTRRQAMTFQNTEKKITQFIMEYVVKLSFTIGGENNICRQKGNKVPPELTTIDSY